MKQSVHTLHLTVILLFVLTVVSCSKSPRNEEKADFFTALPEETQEEVTVLSDNLEIAELMMKQFQMTPSIENLVVLKEYADALTFDYDDADLTNEQKRELLKMKLSADSVRLAIESSMESAIQTLKVDLIDKRDHLIEETTTFPFTVSKGDTLFISSQLSAGGTLRLFNADSKQLLKTYTKSTVEDKVPVSNSAIYFVEVVTTKSQYLDLNVKSSSNTLDNLLGHRTVTEEYEEGVKSDFRVKSVKGIKMQNLFEEPRKFTLRGQLKAAFSGSYRALVALQVPSGATDVVYSLRISTNESDRSDDGEFYDNMCTSYNKIRFMGLPLYESQRGSGLIATLLGDNQPLREEDAYINMYVFYDASQAKKFQDGTPAAELKYNVDYSTLGTQSCNGRIPSRGNKTIYLAFENERMRFNNYVWLEAISAVPTTEYFKPVWKKTASSTCNG